MSGGVSKRGVGVSQGGRSGYVWGEGTPGPIVYPSPSAHGTWENHTHTHTQVLTPSEDHQNKCGWQAGGTHPNGMLSCWGCLRGAFPKNCGNILLDPQKNIQ